MNIYQRPNFFDSIEIYNNGTQVWSYSVGDTLTIKAIGVNAAYKSAFQGITFLASDGTTELAYTPTSEGWNSEDNTEYDMTFTVPDTFNDNLFVTTKFNTTGMYDIDFDVAYAEGLINPTYSYALIKNNYINKALPGTIVTLKIDVTLLDAETELALDNWSGLSGISASDFGTWNTTWHSSTTLQMECTFTMPSNNVAMTANFKEAGATVTHTVTFKNGLITVDTVEVEEGTAIPSADIPTVTPPTGMEFNYWADEDNNEFDFDTLITEDITLYAKFKVSTYTVTFKEGNTTIKTVEVTYNHTVSYIDPQHMTDASGKEFMYWVDSNSQKFDFSTSITEDTTLTAYYAQAGSSKWIMSLPNCFVGLKSDVDYLPIARVDDGTKALALSETAGEETAYIFHKASLTWIELQHYTVNI